VVVLGHPGYYPRFGFEPARPLGIETYYAPDDAWMALRLPAYDPQIRGTVRYPPAWP
jgi:putative acetyltransferase